VLKTLSLKGEALFPTAELVQALLEYISPISKDELYLTIFTGGIKFLNLQQYSVAILHEYVKSVVE